jgi:uncharacterized membrane protein YhaH (DUF805 family)
VRRWLKKDGPMLGFLFGFNARLGRLHYFLSTIGLAVGMTVVAFAIASYAVHNTPTGADPSAHLMLWPVIVSVVVFLWITFTLQSMRLRDIGWDPVCVIPAWMALLIVDKLVAAKFPAWSLGSAQQGTVVSALVNFALVLALTFWPSGADNRPAPTIGEAGSKPHEPPRHQAVTSLPAARIARAPAAGFGRRVS